MKKEINPIPVIIVAVLAVVAAGYFFFIRPAQVDASIQKQWVTAEAAEARHDGRKTSADKQKLRDQILAKEGINRSAAKRRRDDTN